MKKLFKFIMEVFYEDEVEIKEAVEEETISEEDKKIISDLKSIRENNNLVPLLNNGVVGIYLLDVFSSSITDIITDSERLNNVRNPVSVTNYFEKYTGRIYDHIDLIISLVENDKLSFMMRSDIKEVISMFQFYIRNNNNE